MASRRFGNRRSPTVAAIPRALERTQRPREANSHPVVVNTVQQCQTVAKALRHFKPICYHSKFIFKHREEKEKQINECRPSATHCNAGGRGLARHRLRYSADRVCPFDALVQRAGRGNRARLLEFGRVLVHRHEKKSERVYSNPPGILESTWNLLSLNQGLLTERRLIELLRRSTGDSHWRTDDAFRRILSTIEDHQSRLAGVLDAPRPWEDDALLKTRPDDYPQRSVIPEIFTDLVMRLPPRDRRRYELKMPIWYTRHNVQELEGIPFCTMKYGARYGGHFSPVPWAPRTVLRSLLRHAVQMGLSLSFAAAF